MELWNRRCEAVPPPNTPLTPEELREMNGEPVWFEYLYPLNPPEGVWTIARGIRNNDTAIFDGLCAMSLDHYGETWHAYRRKPEEVPVLMNDICAATGRPCCRCQPGACNSRKPEVSR